MSQVNEIDAKDAALATKTIMLNTATDPVATDTVRSWTGNSLLRGTLKALGFQADPVATTDTGTSSLIALFKRHLEKTSDVVTALDNAKAKATAASPAYTEGTDNALSQNLSGQLRVIATGGASDASDANAPSSNHLPTISHLNAFNGSTWDRLRSGILAATATPTGFLNVLSMGRYNATPSALTEGQVGILQTDVNGNLLVNPQVSKGVGVADSTTTRTVEGGNSIYYLANAAAKTDIKTAAGTLKKLWGENKVQEPRYIQVFNALAANVTLGTTAPLYVIPIAPASHFEFNFNIGHNAAISYAVTDTETGNSAATISTLNIEFQ